MREFSSVEQLLVLANIESMNAEFIRMEFPQSERLKKLNEIPISQLSILTKHAGVRKLSSQNSLADENKKSLKEPEA